MLDVLLGSQSGSIGNKTAMDPRGVNFTLLFPITCEGQRACSSVRPVFWFCCILLCQLRYTI